MPENRIHDRFISYSQLNLVSSRQPLRPLLRSLIVLVLISHEITDDVSVVERARGEKLVHNVDNAVQAYTVREFDLVPVDVNGRLKMIETAILLAMAGKGDLLFLGLPVQRMVREERI